MHRLRSGALAALGLLAGIPARAQTLERASVATSGAEGNGLCSRCAISADGRWVAFASEASNLVPNDFNSVEDVFVRDRQSQTTERVSLRTSGIQGNGISASPSISGDGRLVVFASDANNLVAGDTNQRLDIFVRDRASSTTTRVSMGLGGAQVNGDCSSPVISADGRFVAFRSLASNLVPGDTNGQGDVFVIELASGTIELASLSTGGALGDHDSDAPAISADGRFVAFDTLASTFLAPDKNASRDVFVRDRLAGTTELVSLSTIGIQARLGGRFAAISSDGRFVAFTSGAENLVADDSNGMSDVFVRDRASGTTERVNLASDGTEGDQLSPGYSALSADGRFVAFASYATNIVPGDTNHANDIFVRDRSLRTTVRASLSDLGVQGDADSLLPAFSASGRELAFVSAASTLVPGDGNHAKDVFVLDVGAGLVRTYCTAHVNSQGCVPQLSSSGVPSASGSAPFVVSASLVINRKRGLLFYGFAADAAPVHAGILCVREPLTFTAVQTSGGNPPPDDCSGVLAYDMNARIRSGVDPSLVPGADVFAQFMSRDPASPGHLSLTDAISFRIEP